MARLILDALTTLGFLFAIATLSPLVHWWATTLAGPWRDPVGDVLIVPAGSILEDGTIGESSYWRSVYAVQAWRQGGFREVVLSGAKAAQAMAAFLESQGVPARVIRIEAESRSTRESALYTTRLLEKTPGRKVLLTSDFHMFRAWAAFDRAGLKVLPRPFPDARKRAAHWKGRWPAFLDVAEETVKIGYYWAQGWI